MLDLRIKANLDLNTFLRMRTFISTSQARSLERFSFDPDKVLTCKQRKGLGNKNELQCVIINRYYLVSSLMPARRTSMPCR